MLGFRDEHSFGKHLNLERQDVHPSWRIKTKVMSELGNETDYDRQKFIDFIKNANKEELITLLSKIPDEYKESEFVRNLINEINTT